MKTTYQKTLRWALAALVLPASIACAETKPAAPILPDTFGTVVIGDISGLLDKIGALASKVVDGMNPSMIKQQAGAMIGDAQLEGLPAGSGLAVVIPKQGLPYAFLEVSPAKLAQYQELFKARKMGQVGEAEGLLVAAADQAGLDSAKAAAAQVKSTVLAGNGSPTLSGSVKLADVLKQYDETIQNGIKSMADKVKQAEGATSGPVLSARDAQTIFRAYYAAAKRIDTFQLGFEPSAEGMTMNYDITPASKSATSDAGDSGASLMKLLPGGGAMRGHGAFDMAAMGKLVTEIAQEIATDGDQKINVTELTKWFDECAQTFGGTMAVNFMADTAAPLTGHYAISVKDATAALKFLKEMPEKLESTGFLKLYESMGIPMKVTFAEKVRSYKDLPIHQLTLNMEFANGSEAQKERLKKIMGNLVYEVALVDKVLLYAVKPQKIEELIDAAQSGSNPAAKPLVSEQSLPAGARGYFDYNVGAAMLIAFEMGAEQKGADVAKKMAEAIKDAPPVKVAWYDQGASFRVTVQMPSEMLKSFVAVGQQASQAAQSKSGTKIEMDGETVKSSSGSRSNGSRPVKTGGPRTKKAE